LNHLARPRSGMMERDQKHAEGGRSQNTMKIAHKKPANQADIARPFRYGEAGFMVDHIIDNGLSDSSRHSFGQKHDRQ